MNIDMFVELVAFQSEGVDALLDRLEAAGVTQITLEPRYFVETGDSEDLRLPPLDLDGRSRVLDRPLFGGERVKYGKKHFCFEPNLALYSKTNYRPPYERSTKDFCAHVVNEAKARGFIVSIFLPNVPSGGYHADELPKNVFGEHVVPRISNEACRNVNNVLEYYIALTKNLCDEYTADAVMIDWMEFTNYFFTDNLICFCASCKEKMETLGYSEEKLIEAAKSVYRWVGEQTATIRTVDALGGWHECWEHICPEITELFNFKQAAMRANREYIRSQLDSYGKNEVNILFTGFGAPMNNATGARSFVDKNLSIQVQPKSYRFHWGLMVRWYAEELAQINGKTSPDDWIPFVQMLLEISDPSVSLDGYYMPEPDEIGPIDIICEQRKEAAFWEASKENPFASIRLHGYGPVTVFDNRMRVAKELGYNYVSIQRYGYLGDEKLACLKKYVE